MASLKVLNMDGAPQPALEASDTVFAAPLNETLVQEVVVGFMANQRQGTHQVKTRAMVSGGGIKPFRQKGTGRARQGSSREPHMRGGGTVFGPVPRSYRKNVTPRLKRQALCCMLSQRLRDERLDVLAGLKMDAPKTKPLVQALNKVASDMRKTLIVLAELDKNVLLSARNVPRVTVRTASDLHAADVMLAHRVILQQEAVQKLEERLS